MSKMNSTKTTLRRGASALPRIVYESPPLSDEDVAQAVTLRVDTYARDTAANGVLVADGAAMRIGVDRSALVVDDGVGESRRSRRFERATHGLNRIVVLGGSGSISIEALHWCRRLGIAVLVLAPDGTASLASTPRFTDDARLRRIQARALDEPVGMDLACRLIAAKLTGQADLLASRFNDWDTAATITELAQVASVADDIDELRQIEASGASLYWQSWARRPECEPRFVTRDLRRIPPHWTRYEGRRSVLAGVTSNRKAERPVNAIINYLYALLEAEAVLACHVVGLDPGLGLVHSDTKGRASFALDLIEPIRPVVDRWVLDFLERRTFRKAEFTEISDGHCRLLAPLTHELAEAMPLWARALAPIAEDAAHVFGRALAGKYQAATPLTSRRTRESQAVVNARKAVAKGRREAAPRMHQLPDEPLSIQERWCLDCGGRVFNARHVRCTDCIDLDPSQSEDVRSRRGRAISSRKRALVEWDRANPGAVYDPELFRRDILPGLAKVHLSAIQEAAGISKTYASQVRSGKYTPHVSTWGALAELVGGLDAGI
jgi:CRISPR-associated endonuclease Cas1